jgi:hypothetical protein
MTYSVVTNTATAPAGGTVLSLTATCPSGTQLSSGGFLENDNSGDVIFTRSTPLFSSNGWQVTARNTASSLLGASHQVTSYAICVKTS